jgi:Fur family ferric uptake transcriptional regulator
MKKHRRTTARTNLLKILESAASPVCADEILKLLPVNKTTVYRQLQSLIDQGLAVPVNFSDRTIRYESIKAGHHHHLICTKCHWVSDVSIPENIESVIKPIAQNKKFRVRSHQLEFFGLCANCQS